MRFFDCPRACTRNTTTKPEEGGEKEIKKKKKKGKTIAKTLCGKKAEVGGEKRTTKREGAEGERERKLDVRGGGGGEYL